jgi:HPt (histidine-containing phosphotransfer) domain-containing protein
MPPGMDGMQTAKALRKLDPRIYIVIVTAFSDIDPKQIHKELVYGVLYLNKPFGALEVEQIARMLSQAWRQQYLQESNNNGAAATDLTSKSTADQDASSFDNELFDEELMDVFHKNMREKAANLELAAIDGDWVELKLIAHSIKGTTASFGYPELSKQAKDVQLAIDEGRMDEVQVLSMNLVSEVTKVLPA